MNQKGMTLIELLISVAILSASLIVIYKPLLAASTALHIAEERQEAFRLVDRQFWQIKEKLYEEDFTPPTEMSGALNGKTHAYHYRIFFKPLTDDDRLYRIHTVIEWKSAGIPKSLNRTIYFYLPEKEAEDEKTRR